MNSFASSRPSPVSTVSRALCALYSGPRRNGNNGRDETVLISSDLSQRLASFGTRRPVSAAELKGRFMRTDSRKWLPFVLVLFALSKVAYGQEASVTGTITDATGAVLPGVTIVAVHEASGKPVRRRHRWPRRLSHSRPCRHLPNLRRSGGFHARGADGRPAPGRSDGHSEHADVALHRTGDRHGHGGSAAHRDDAVDASAATSIRCR